MVIDNLERDGLVSRERVPTDRRVMSVTLTAKGQLLIARVLPEHVATIRDIFRLLPPDEVADLAALTRTLGLAVTQQLDDDPLREKLRERPVLLSKA